ncbi:hypothetical protein [Aggregatibacter actinomycetemcomitans]|uniref:hypothetical protein n=1 Tax=Aggregatibacter actinomycetemcomitans TaxID=714 RepID=UPI0002400858|nr:hypothetical protein [Aggregatibacter actinomycetemcomitans]EHK89875.1 hypothetical protein RHAA1_08353 [Aggregatibacter actinomycetemcomitans RhAA1]KNE76967.1 hypothetical protein RHAA2_08535 [Aggregatibacter actinomycetemcomitans RhAA1]MBN6070747.1 hypothetical protein [Aggregatibacter actinomycetemcomitans]
MNQLGLLENFENKQQLKEFLKYNNISEMDVFKANIKILNLNLNDIEININSGDRNNWGVINIYWEKKINNYKELGLYGLYRSDYYHIKFNQENNMLIISNERTEIQINTIN